MSTGQLSDAARGYFERHRIQALLEEAMHDLLVAQPDDPLAHLQHTLQQRTPLRLIVTGPPGAGKRTQCALLARAYGLRHLRVDEVLHRACAGDSEAGRVIAAHWQRGAVVPDDVVAEAMLRAARAAEQDNLDDNDNDQSDSRNTHSDVSGRHDARRPRGGWVFDAFPQQRAQAMYLQAHGLSPQKVIELDVSDAVVRQRLGSETASADSTSATTDRRATEQSVATRLRYYAARKDELMNCYSAFYVRVDGAGDVAAVHKEMCEQIDALELPV